MFLLIYRGYLWEEKKCMKPKRNNYLLDKKGNENITEEIRNLSKKKECNDITVKENNRLWYLQHRIEQINRALEWGKKHPDRVKINKSNFRRRNIFKKLSNRANKVCDDKLIPFDLWKLAKKQKLKCPITDDKLTKENISLDHIIPLSKGGKNIISNIRLTTKEANWLKNTHTDEQLFILCRKIVETFKPNI